MRRALLTLALFLSRFWLRLPPTQRSLPSPTWPGSGHRVAGMRGMPWRRREQPVAGESQLGGADTGIHREAVAELQGGAR